MSSAIKVEQVNKSYGANQVLKNINMEINEGEFVCLLGPSGCGKSTLLRIIAGLDMPSSGKVFLSGKDATKLPAYKRNFGIVFQSYALFPNLTAFENVAYGLKNNKVRSKDVYEIVDGLFTMIGLPDAKNRYPAQLSGGEQQRVALARALALRPDFLLLDEPLSALDAKVRIHLRKEICKIQKELKLTTIMVTHDQDEALTMADKIIVMNKAEIMQSGTPLEIYEKPQKRFVADFIGAVNFFQDRDEKKTELAIRPENIEISLEKSDDSIGTTVEDIEFRGSFSRVTVETGALENNTSFCIDIPWKQVKDMGLMLGKKIFIRMQQEHVLKLAE